jgi:hypothetical protein
MSPLVIYHHLQYTYRNFKKFQHTSHLFINAGYITAGIIPYLRLELGLQIGLRIGFNFHKFYTYYIMLFVNYFYLEN